jgi:hypothetical protein
MGKFTRIKGMEGILFSSLLCRRDEGNGFHTPIAVLRSLRVLLFKFPPDRGWFFEQKRTKETKGIPEFYRRKGR